MHFATIHEGQGSKASKLAIVAAIHLLVGVAFVKSVDMRKVQMPDLPEEIAVFLPETPKPPPPPPEPPKPRTEPVHQPKIVAPAPEVKVEQPPPPDTVQASSEPDPTPAEPSPPAPPAPPQAPAEPGNGTMRSAVLADANGCAKPEYPARAARNGETGTVTLALLVDTDGSVARSRVTGSSGSRELDRAAQSALSLCRFKPAVEGGQPQQAWAQIAYVWTLND